jgi:PQQ-dependent catabolism-associated beta-propeller protein
MRATRFLVAGLVTVVAGPAALQPNEPLQPSRQWLVVSNEGSRDLSILDARQGTLLGTVPLDGRPRGIRPGPDGRLAYVAVSDDAPNAESPLDAIVAVNLATRRVVARLAAGSDPEQFDLTPDGRILVASNEDAGTASATSLASARVLATLVVGIEPEGVAISPDGRWAAVTAETSNSLSLIDLKSLAVVGNVLVDVRPRGVVFSPDSRTAWVSAEIGSSLAAIDVEGRVVRETLVLEGGSGKPVGVAVSPDGRRVYVANGGTGTVSVVDGAEMKLVATVKVGRRPWGLALSRDGGRLYIANGLSDDVSVVNTASLRVERTFGAGKRPWGVAVIESSRRP